MLQSLAQPVTAKERPGLSLETERLAGTSRWPPNSNYYLLTLFFYLLVCIFLRCGCRDKRFFCFDFLVFIGNFPTKNMLVLKRWKGGSDENEL